jgi:hypothetical protein
VANEEIPMLGNADWEMMEVPQAAVMEAVVEEVAVVVVVAVEVAAGAVTDSLLGILYAVVWEADQRPQK